MGENAEILFDLSETQWIGLLPLSLLYGLILQLRGRRVRVGLKLSDRRNEGLDRLLTLGGFIASLQRLGVEVTDTPAVSLGTGVATFLPFTSRDELIAYEGALSATGLVKELIGGGDDIEVVSSGDFRDILLHELGENAFLHGEGKAVRFSMAEFSRHKPDLGGFEAFFDGRRTLEILVSDSGPGLVRTLAKSIPEGWKPTFEHDRKISPGALACAYALEFSSTCDPAGRSERLRRILEDGGDFADAVPTGLFYVASLTRRYGGQLIIRTGRNSVSIDFSEPGVPKLRENPIGRQGAQVQGTHVLVRIPRDARGKVHALPQRRRSASATRLVSRQPIILEELWDHANRQPHEFLIRVESSVELLLVLPPEEQKNAIVLIANGLSCDTKTLSLLLSWLGVVPHKNWILVVCGLSEQLTSAAIEQSAQVARLSGSSRERLRAWQPFLLSSDDPAAVMYFGTPAEKVESLPSISQIYESSLREAVGGLLQKPPVQHPKKPNRYYLIEQKYYTQDFYEIRQLSSPALNPLGAALAVALIAAWAKRLSIDAVFIVSEPLAGIFLSLTKALPVTTRCFSRHEGKAQSSFVFDLVSTDRNARILLLTDVICTAKQFSGYLQQVPNLESCFLSALIDGRDDDLQAVPVRRGERYYNVNVLSALRCRISAIDNLPHVDDPEILLIDRHTHAPTSREAIGEVQIKTDELLATAGQCDALQHGHLVFKGKHFVDLVRLPTLFEHLKIRIEKFWQRTIDKLSGLRLEPRQVTVLYLQEDGGWEHLVPRWMATKGLAECRPISREELFAPRVENEAVVKGICVWFILPVIASGATTRRCLEYASRLNSAAQGAAAPIPVNRIVVSAQIGRMAPAELSFYTGIRGYRGASTHIEVMSLLPLPVFSSENDCPTCIFLRHLDSNIRRIEGHSILHAACLSARDDLIARESLAGSSSQTRDPASTIVLAQMSSLYEQGNRDVQMRRRLGEMLKSEEARIHFLEMLGAHCDPIRFAKTSLELALYSHYEVLRSTASDLLRSNNVSELTTCRLLGVHFAFPDLLAVEIKWILKRAVEQAQSDVTNRVVMLGVLDPTCYGKAVASISHSLHAGGLAQREVVSELANCTLWFGDESGAALKAFEKLVWLLRRSTVWGSGIEELRTFLQTDAAISDRARVSSEIHRFELTGVGPMLGSIAALRTLDHNAGLWSAVRTEEPQLELLIDEINAVWKTVRVCGASDVASERGRLSELVHALDTKGRELRAALESIYLNVSDAIENVQQLARWPVLRHAKVRIEFTVADNQPGVLFGLTHMIGLLNAVLENVAEHVTRHGIEEIASPLRVEFRFTGLTADRQASLLEVYDNIPFERALVPTGGLKQAKEHCELFGAMFDVSDSSEAALPRIRITLRTNRAAREYAN
jgi:hypothetical protein